MFGDVISDLIDAAADAANNNVKMRNIKPLLCSIFASKRLAR